METIDCPKCSREHTPSGSHEDDEGEMECDGCGFVFIVEIEYEPSYETRCKEHKFGEFKPFTTRAGETVIAKFCEYCGTGRLKEEETMP